MLLVNDNFLNNKRLLTYNERIHFLEFLFKFKISGHLAIELDNSLLRSEATIFRTQLVIENLSKLSLLLDLEFFRGTT